METVTSLRYIFRGVKKMMWWTRTFEFINLWRWKSTIKIRFDKIIYIWCGFAGPLIVKSENFLILITPIIIVIKSASVLSWSRVSCLANDSSFCFSIKFLVRMTDLYFLIIVDVVYFSTFFTILYLVYFLYFILSLM